ncbi:DUF6443 domain-containing protein [Sphingobacterium faecium]|uniref:DUF6443 domain-containing protein n=1 Tax=Sphingobacterium faecium TaxID=34087 RepID=UPI00293BBD75|nr:DUF6443 domain-containing protein [Sphingobacterium faecium]
MDSVNIKIQYIDGLGRPMQVVDWQGSPLKNDITQHIAYDGFGRESIQYLPYAKNTVKDGAFKPNASADQLVYYASSSTWDPHIKKTDYPYAVTVFENSPLNRVQQKGAPGLAWQPDADRTAVVTTSTTGHTAVTEYGTNAAGDVRLWSINSTGTGATSSFYAAGKLYKTVIKDENWINTTGKTRTVEEYKDFEGRVVLKRNWETDTKKLETHYVYDDFGDLRYVIPPGYTATTVTDNSTDFNELLYAYRYDGKRRLIEKKIPGKGWEYLVYNRNDQLILNQDANQRGQQKWSYSKYDPFDRVTSTGIYTNTAVDQTSREQVQALADAVTAQWETRSGTAYTNTSFPSTAAQLLELTVNYYDDYSFKTITVLSASTGLDSTWMVKGLLTGSKVRQDDGTVPLLSVNYYDKRARVVETVSDNHLGGVDRITNTYNFPGDLVTSKKQHRINGSAQVTTILTTNSYDHAGRLLTTKKKVNTQDEILQSKLAYNEIGQLKTKSLHSENGGTNFLSSVGYSYNERGWTTKATSPQFTYVLNYNLNSAGTAVLSAAQYNGNITQQLFGHAATTNSTFTYTYDGLNRLKKGSSTGTVMSETLTYDNMGNIKTLTRDTGSPITYTYSNANKSNRLESLSGGLTGTFIYDNNGNATQDRTGMQFTYNQLNLPKAAIGGDRSISYRYDAMGTKLKKQATVGGIVTEQDYIGGIEYSKVGSASSTIERIATEEGFLLNSDGAYSYYYNLTDHLGNVRSVIKREGSATVPSVVQKQDYYPFGKTKSIATSINNKYLYNGKEMQSDLSLGTHTLGSSYVLEGQLDYGARFYDAEIGRWNVVDPSVEKYESISPYSYTFNNPTRFIDIKGKDPGDIIVFFTGGILGAPIQGNTKTTQILYNNLVANRNGESVILYTSVYYNPDQIIESAFTHIQGNAKAFPNGKVVLYGYSYGGVIANKLAGKLKDAGINVNLMISVDAANGYWSDEVDRNISDNVDLNLNFFETNGKNFTFPDITMSYGGKNKGKNVVNVDKSNDKFNGEKMNHMNIDDATFGISQKAIMELIQNSGSGQRTLTRDEINNLFNR